jgi:hypothetical protein
MDIKQGRKKAAPNIANRNKVEIISHTFTPSKLKSYWGIKKAAATKKTAQIEKIILNLLFGNMVLLKTIPAHPWVKGRRG